MDYENIKDIAKTFSKQYHETFIESKGEKNKYFFILSENNIITIKNFIAMNPINCSIVIKLFNETIVEETFHRYDNLKDEKEILAISLGMATTASAIICQAAMETVKSYYTNEQNNFKTTEIEMLKQFMNKKKDIVDDIINNDIDLNENPFSNLDFTVEWPPENFIDE